MKLENSRRPATVIPKMLDYTGRNADKKLLYKHTLVYFGSPEDWFALV